MHDSAAGLLVERAQSFYWSTLYYLYLGLYRTTDVLSGLISIYLRAQDFTVSFPTRCDAKFTQDKQGWFDWRRWFGGLWGRPSWSVSNSGSKTVPTSNWNIRLTKWPNCRCQRYAVTYFQSNFHSLPFSCLLNVSSPSHPYPKSFAKYQWQYTTPVT